MGSIRTLSGRGTLFMDFRYLGRRCREYTALDDTPANRKRLEKALAKIEADIESGTFDYAATFPTSRNASTPGSESPSPAAPFSATAVASAAAQGPAVASPTFRDFTTTWLVSCPADT